MTTASATRLLDGKLFIALSGGVGGAKLCLGLAQVLEPDQLTLIANTGDDFEHLGLAICPDLDTVLYTLAGLANTETGWGRAGESWHLMEELERLGDATWFKLGDRDLAIHLVRTKLMDVGATLSEATGELCRRLRVRTPVFPMTDQRVRTMVTTPQGELSFQHYFVRDRCAPRVLLLRFDGAEEARASPGFERALHDLRLAAIVICPSNPFVSIDPILALPRVAETLRAAAPIVAVSPIIAGQALKGPAAKMMAELGLDVSAVAVARHYQQRALLDGFVLDQRDAELRSAIEALGVRVLVTDTIMNTAADKQRLALQVLAFAATL